MKITNKLASIANSLSTKQFLIILILSFIGFIFFNIYLGILFEETGYPVQLLVSQTRFDALELKSDFSILIELGTLSDYILIQYLDLGIMVFTTVFFLTLALFITKRVKSVSWRNRGYMASLFFPISSLLDLIENTFLLIMLKNPLEFADWLAIAYSTSAVVKLCSFLLGLILLVLVPIVGRKTD